ncbi:ATP-binding protein [Bosea sp. 117]|uniref:hybrid sensor histidine kinase/response regulator n=1 Tax=Bosea sp. 117 TaxID=1125973 RepID=UPI0018CC692E|nr:ATP-binding protein [Bosea sp. 117]
MAREGKPADKAGAPAEGAGAKRSAAKASAAKGPAAALLEGDAAAEGTAAQAPGRALSRALAHAGHELKTPLAGMIGLAELLLDTNLTAEQRNYAHLLKSSGETLLDIVDGLLAPHGPAPEATVFDPAALAVETVELLGLRAQARGLELASVVAPGLPAQVVGEAAALRQILTNLLANAIKFTRAGGATLELAPAGDGVIRFEVRDTGPGIAPRERAAIFRESVRGAAADGSAEPGSGLGLAIVARLAARLGIAIELAGSPAGSRFWFDMKLPAASPTRSAAPALAEASVLIASPSPVLREALGRQLVLWGARVETACSPAGLDARLDTRSAPSGRMAMLIDAAFPADTLAAALRSGQPAARRIALITPGQRALLPRLMALGCDTYLVKPVRPASLASRIAGDAPAADLASAEMAVEAESGIATSARRRLRVLIGEDDDVNALLLAALIGRLGHMPVRAVDGEAALVAFREAAKAGRPFDMALVDIGLPVRDGISAASMMRALRTGALLVGMTAGLDAASRSRAESAGLSVMLDKPVDRARLAELLAAAAKKRGAA